jgi:cell division protease FtsH
MTKAQRRFLEEVRQRRARATAARTSSQAQGVRLSRDGNLIMNRTERRRTAYHEAGHAVINAVVGIRFRRVTIVPWRHLLGRVERRRLPDIFWRNPIQIRRLILSCLSGGITEKLARRDGQASGLSEDLTKATMLIRRLPGCRTISGRLRRHIEMYRQADALVRRHWDVIGEVAERLVRDKTLSECQVLGIFKETSLAALIEMLSAKDGDLLLRRGVNRSSCHSRSFRSRGSRSTVHGLEEDGCSGGRQLRSARS